MSQKPTAVERAAILRRFRRDIADLIVDKNIDRLLGVKDYVLAAFIVRTMINVSELADDIKEEIEQQN